MKQIYLSKDHPESLLYVALLHVQANINLRYGICFQALDHTFMFQQPVMRRIEVDELMARLFTQWPELLGDDILPIGGVEEFILPREGRWTGKRGWLRRDLLQFMIDELEEELSA